VGGTAFLFPGQGAHKPGMGADLCEAYEAAAEVFRAADEALGYPISEKVLRGTEEDLADTAAQQPAIIMVELAALAVMRETAPEIRPRLTAGLSLGEYAALVAAGSIGGAEALSLVEKRGRYMAEAASEAPGGMSSVIGLGPEECVAACAEAAAAGRVSAANFNSPLQTVISGEIPAVERAEEICRARGAKKVVRLNVSGAFHSELMSSASEKLAAALDGVEIREPEVDVIQNVTGRPERDPVAIRENLVKQLTSPVLWTDTMAAVVEAGVDAACELGPGKVLAGLFKRTNRSVKVTGLFSAESFAALAGS